MLVRRVKYFELLYTVVFEKNSQHVWLEEK